jgi:hypothetical protein
MNELRDTEARVVAARSQLAVLQELQRQLHADIAELQPRYLFMKAEVDKWKATAREVLASPGKADADEPPEAA